MTALTPPVEALFDAPLNSPQTSAIPPVGVCGGTSPAGPESAHHGHGEASGAAGSTRPADIVITVYGVPGPQGSKNVRGFRPTKDGRLVANLVESSAKVKPWRQDVKAAALDAMVCTHIGGVAIHRPPLDGPLALHVVFTAVRPKSHYRTGRNAHLLRDSAPARPSGPPDLSKLIRSTEDALTEAGVWVDDAQVVEVFAEKRFAGEGPDSLDRPGAMIRVRAIGGAL